MAYGRTCPHCGKDRLIRWENAQQVYRTREWIADGRPEPADGQIVCSWCLAVEEETGDWRRLKPAHERARELATSSTSRHDRLQEIYTDDT